MAAADIERVMNVSKDRLFEVLTTYEDYPKFLPEVQKVEVTRNGPHQAKVKYNVSMIKDVIYSVIMTEDREAGTLKWLLDESAHFKTNSGCWTLESKGDMQCWVRFEVEIDFNFPAPGFIVKKVVKGNLPKMLNHFEERAKG